MITLFGSNVGKEELKAVQEAIENQWLGIGPKVDEFEQKIAEKIQLPDFVFVNSGSNALQLAVHLLDLPKGSEVIIPSFTWIACANSVMLEGLKPVFCDVDYSTCNMRAEDVESKITPQTSAIMVVHYAGKPVDMDALKQFGLPVIEDAAHAVDSYYKGKHCGAIGDVGIFSFDAVKNLTTGEGGGVISADPEKMDRARKLRYCGIGKSGFQASKEKSRWWEYEISATFPKMLNTDIAAGIGIEQLKKLDKFQERRKKLWQVYRDTLGKEGWANSWIDVPSDASEGEQHSYFTFCIKLKVNSRDDLAKFLYERGIYSSLRFHPLHLNSFYGPQASLPNCEKLNNRALNIPFHHRLSDQDIDTIISALKDFQKTLVAVG